MKFPPEKVLVKSPNEKNPAARAGTVSATPSSRNTPPSGAGCGVQATATPPLPPVPAVPPLVPPELPPVARPALPPLGAPPVVAPLVPPVPGGSASSVEHEARPSMPATALAPTRNPTCLDLVFMISLLQLFISQRVSAGKSPDRRSRV